MKALPTIDFVAPVGRPWIGVLLATLLALFVSVEALKSLDLEAGNRDLAATVAQRSAARPAPAPRKPTEAERLRYAQVSAVAGELGAPWSDLLAAFEEHGSGDVGLLKLEPDARAGTVRVTGQARNTHALFGYVRALEADPRLDRVVLTNHQLERTTPGMPLRFVVQAAWRRHGAAGKETS